MALKFNLKNVTNDDLEKAKADAAKGNFTPYSGPIAPKGLYNVKVGGIWAGETNSGDGKIVVALEIAETGDLEVYNGCPVWMHLVVPSDPSDQYFAIRMKSLDDLFQAASGGKLNINGFVDALNEGRVKVGKADKVGEPIEQIGKFKTDTAREIKLMLKDPREYNGKQYADPHYIDIRDLNKVETETDSGVDDDVDGLDDDDIDGLLGDLDD